VVLSGDALVGGTGRWDIRGATSGAFGGILDLGGFTLRKQGSNKISISDVVVANDGTIEVLSGTLAITRSQVGGAAPIIIGTNILQFENNSVTNAVVSKPLVTDRSLIQLVGNSYGIYSPITNLGGATIDVASGLIFTLSNTISGGGVLTKTNTGTLLLNTSNIFTGNIILQAGALQVGNNLALGASNTVYVTNTTAATGGTGPTLDLLTNIVTPSSLALSLYTTYSPDIRGSLRAVAGGTEWKGPITLIGDGRFGLYADVAGSSLIVSGPINGPTSGATSVLFIRGASGVGQLNGQANFIGQLFKTDAGTWLVNSTSNHWSSTGIAVSTVRLGANDALCVTAPLTMGQSDANPCVLDLNGFNQTVPGLSFVAGTSSAGTRRIGNDSTNSDSVFTFAGTNVSTYGGQFVDKVTTNGTHKLSLTVASGTLYLNGSNTCTGPTLVQSGATLGGNGALLSSVTVQSGGTLAPGSGSVGRLAISNSLAFASGSTNFVELNPATPTNDMVVGLSSVTYGGTLLITNVSSVLLTNGATFKLFDAAARSGSFDNVVSRTPNQIVTWDTSRLPVDGTITVVQSISTQPPNITAIPSGGVLAISWPADHLGWRLLGETNSLSMGLTTNAADWFSVPDSASTNAVYLNIDPANGAVFYRLVYP
jgi:autotransporter-associated beta strand protein